MSTAVNAVKIALLQINPHGRRSRRQRPADCGRRARGASRRAPSWPSRRSSRSSAICRAICCSAPASCAAAGTSLATLADDAAGRPPVLVGLPEPNPIRRRTSALQHRRAAARRPRRPALPQGAPADLRRVRRGPLLRAVPRTRRCSSSAAAGSASASARTSGTIATSGSGGATTSIRSRSCSHAGADAIVNLSASPFSVGKHAPARRDARQHGRASIDVPVVVREPGRRQRRPRLRRPQLARSTPTARSSRAAAPSHADVVICRSRRERRRSRRRRRPAAEVGDLATRSCSARATTSASAASRAPSLGLSGGIDSALTAAIAAEARRRRPRARRPDAVAVFEPRQRRRLARARGTAWASPR